MLNTAAGNDSIIGPNGPGEVTATTSADLRAAARASFEETIAHYERKIIEAKRQINTLALVHRLPPEILGIVFTILASGILYRPYEWITFTHVCHEWRQVALNTPRAWNRISMRNNFQFMSELFSRSKQCPLDVSWLTVVDNNVAGLVFANFHRMASFKMYYVSKPIQTSSQGPPSAPLLRRLKFYTDELSLDGVSSVAMLLWNCRMPQLSHLEIISRATHTFSWSDPIFKNSLAHLTFTDIIPRGSVALGEVLAALGGMPCLKELDLNGVLPHPPTHDTCPSVHFPRLETLSITDWCGSCTLFLQHITYSGTTRVWITLTSGNDAEFSVFRDTISAKIRRDSPIRSFRIGERRPNRGVMAWYEQIEAIKLEDVDRIEENGADLRIDLCDNYATSFQYIVDIVQSLSLSSVHTLSLSGGTRYSHTWKSISNAIPHVVELCIASDDITLYDSEPPDLLVIPSASGSDEADTSIFLDVKTLLLQEIKFRRTTGPPGDDDVLPAFQRMLRSRKVAGRMIEELIIQDGININQRDIDEFKGMVGKVRWDPASEVWLSDEEDNREDEEDEHAYF